MKAGAAADPAAAVGGPAPWARRKRTFEAMAAEVASMPEARAPAQPLPAVVTAPPAPSGVVELLDSDDETVGAALPALQTQDWSALEAASAAVAKAPVASELAPPAAAVAVEVDIVDLSDDEAAPAHTPAEPAQEVQAAAVDAEMPENEGLQDSGDGDMADLEGDPYLLVDPYQLDAGEPDEALPADADVATSMMDDAPVVATSMMDEASSASEYTDSSDEDEGLADVFAVAANLKAVEGAGAQPEAAALFQ